MKRMIILIALLIPCNAHAQESTSLKIPTAVFAGAASADWTTTYRFLRAKSTTEMNPVLKWTKNDPVTTVVAGAAIDVAGTYAWKRLVGKKYPKIAAAGLYAMSGVRIYFVYRNTKIHDQVMRSRR